MSHSSGGSQESDNGTNVHTGLCCQCRPRRRRRVPANYHGSGRARVGDIVLQKTAKSSAVRPEGVRIVEVTERWGERREAAFANTPPKK